MKFNRSSSKATEPVDAAVASEFTSFFDINNKNMVESVETTMTSQPKSNRLFSRKKKEEKDFDMLKTVGGEDDARNDKSARNIFRRRNKADKGSTTESEGTKSTTAVIPAMFAFPNTSSSADKEVREEPSSRSIFRSRSKEQGDASVTKEKVKEVAEPPVVAESTKSSPKLFTKGERTQIKAVVHTFSSDADSIKVEKEETAPVLASPNHVLIKVQVCFVFLLSIYFRYYLQTNYCSMNHFVFRHPPSP
jgi:hypothetical protein